MKIDVTQALTRLDGSPLDRLVEACETCGQPEKTAPVTLRSVCVDALLTLRANEENLAGEEKVRRYKLALRITHEDIVDMIPKDVALIQELVASLYTPLVVGQVWEMLDPKQE